jgi:molybdopterin converting factor small subunit
MESHNIKIKVLYFASIKEALNDKSEEEIEMNENSTVLEFI